MKKILILFLSCMTLFTAYTADAAQYGIYIAPKIGASIQSMSGSDVSNSVTSSGLSTDRGASLSGGLAIGYDLQYSTAWPIRLELEAMLRTTTTAENAWSYRGSNYTANQDVRMDTYFINGYYDFYNSTPFIPYISAGLGMANVDQTMEFAGQKFSANELNAAFNIGAGISWLVIGDFTADFGYRYVYTSETEANFNGYKAKAHPTGHEFLFGMRYTF